MEPISHSAEFPPSGKLLGKFRTMNVPANHLRHEADAVPKRRLTEDHDSYKFLRDWRKSRKLTLRQLAGELDIGTSTLSGWENGDRQVDLADLNRLAGFYGVHPAALLFAPDDNDPRVVEMREASEIAREMPEDSRREWLLIGRKLVKKSNHE